jgi:hypothetical protein
MNRKQYEEALERQNALFDAAMKSLEAMGNVSISIPEELLRAIDAACEVRPLATTKFDYPGVRV